MDDLNSAISSILGDPAKMEQLRSVAQSLGLNPGGGAPPGQNPNGAAEEGNANSGNGRTGGSGGGGFDPSAIASMMQAFQGMAGGGQNSNAPPSGGGGGGLPNMDAISKIAGMMGTFNQSDKNIELLRSLKPHFTPTRAGRIDDAVRIMQLLRMWPSLRDSGLLGSLGNIFGGGPR